MSTLSRINKLRIQNEIARIERVKFRNRAIDFIQEYSPIDWPKSIIWSHETEDHIDKMLYS